MPPPLSHSPIPHPAPSLLPFCQNNRLAVFLATALRTQHAGPTALHALSTAVQVVEMARGTTIYRLNDPADSFYVVVDGRVVLYDVKDKDEAEEGGAAVAERRRGCGCQVCICERWPEELPGSIALCPTCSV